MSQDAVNGTSYSEGYNNFFVRAQPRDPIIDKNFNSRNPLPSSFLANVDVTFFQSELRPSPPGVPPPSPDMYVPLTNRRIPRASNMRRTRPAKYRCPVVGCDKDFTMKHNLHYHLNAHNNHRPYGCKHKDRGCDFSAAAPSTATRHSRTCKHKLKDA